MILSVYISRHSENTEYLLLLTLILCLVVAENNQYPSSSRIKFIDKVLFVGEVA